MGVPDPGLCLGESDRKRAGTAGRLRACTKPTGYSAVLDGTLECVRRPATTRASARHRAPSRRRRRRLAPVASANAVATTRGTTRQHTMTRGCPRAGMQQAFTARTARAHRARDARVVLCSERRRLAGEVEA
jgi:hypothetical protein